MNPTSQGSMTEAVPARHPLFGQGGPHDRSYTEVAGDLTARHWNRSLDRGGGSARPAIVLYPSRRRDNPVGCGPLDRVPGGPQRRVVLYGNPGRDHPRAAAVAARRRRLRDAPWPRCLARNGGRRVWLLDGSDRLDYWRRGCREHRQSRLVTPYPSQTSKSPADRSRGAFHSKMIPW